MDEMYNTRQEPSIGYETPASSNVEYKTSPRRPCCHKGCADCPW
jgi:hypothetical protein